jgi:inorganic pyrophosphatase
MNYMAIIEIPKNSDRRIHKGMHPENAGRFVDLGPLVDVIAVNDGKMPVAYGFIEHTIGTDGEGDEIDVIVFSENNFKTGDSVSMIPFAMLIRSDGDHKVLAHDDTVQIDSLDDLPTDMQKLVMDFNGFKLPIVEVQYRNQTIEYINSRMV